MGQPGGFGSADAPVVVAMTLMNAAEAARTETTRLRMTIFPLRAIADDDTEPAVKICGGRLARCRSNTERLFGVGGGGVNKQPPNNVTRLFPR
ncbi:hypothetical protein GCM10017600_37990 [Streptosporangium carneum]|uniref:Uncharacterized protein n=1 Tax=Streptosporangium carneum TaxID=47481 RepID=A0A9W6ME11_9ACTN|nr:hypothetical protein GCM10017600_37990 [Streptosporangium carneum]